MSISKPSHIVVKLNTPQGMFYFMIVPGVCRDRQYIAADIPGIFEFGEDLEASLSS